MLILSAKVSKRKILIGILIAAAVIALLVYLCGKADTAPGDPGTQTPAADAGSTEGRIAFLESYGWTVSGTPTETQEVKIPENFNDVFTRYNQLQQSQGFDLLPLAGKTVKRYVYAVTNYPDGREDCCATVLVYKNKVVGGDISCTSEGGKVHGFAMPNS